MSGTLNGVMAATTPIGERMLMLNLPGTSDGMVLPVTWRVIPAAARRNDRPFSTSNAAFLIGEPISSTRMSMNSSRSRSNSSAALQRMRSRSFGSDDRNEPNARCAVSTAALMSSTDPAAASVSTASSSGFLVSKYCPPRGGMFLPSIQ